MLQISFDLVVHPGARISDFLLAFAFHSPVYSTTSMSQELSNNSLYRKLDSRELRLPYPWSLLRIEIKIFCRYL
jgi:hypothetical protein